VSEWVLTSSRRIPPCGSVADWGFPTQSLQYADTHVGLQIKCLLLTNDFNQNQNVLANFSKTSHDKIS
jgi:hypothetical protein